MVEAALLLPGAGEPLLLASDYLCPACRAFSERRYPADPPLRLLHVPGHAGSDRLNALSL